MRSTIEFLFFSLIFACSFADAVDRSPNFAIIFTDDQGYGDLSCFGADHVATPRMEQMAAEGSRLTSFYVAAPVCTPSRAAKLAGVDIPTDRVIDGNDVWRTLTGNGGTPHEVFFYHRGKSLTAVRFGKWKHHTKNGKTSQLYDLESDMTEKKNLIESNPAIVTELQKHLKEFAKDVAENNRPAAFVESPKPLTK